MLQSHVIEIDGVFVGAAIRLDNGYRFVATDVRLEEMDSCTWPSLTDIQRIARVLCRVGAGRRPDAKESKEALLF